MPKAPGGPKQEPTARLFDPLPYRALVETEEVTTPQEAAHAGAWRVNPALRREFFVGWGKRSTEANVDRVGDDRRPEGALRTIGEALRGEAR